MRTLSPARATVPSSTASTFSSRPISGEGFLSFLYLITDIREVTRRELICASAVVNASVIASAK